MPTARCRCCGLPERHDDLSALTAIAEKFRAEATDVVFLGTGGSSLGGQTLAQLSGYAVPGLGLLRDGPRLHFLDNLDPETFAQVLARLPLSTSRFIAISKSGGTAETLMQTSAILSAICACRARARDSGIVPGTVRAGNARQAQRPCARCLRRTASPFSITIRKSADGSRSSPMSACWPAAMAGLDIQAIRDGAAAALAPVLASKPPKDVPAAVGAALGFAGAQAGKTISVLMAYADRLERFTHWYVQLWAESLGKDGKGTTPIARARPGRSAQPAAAVPRRPARQARHRDYGRHRRRMALRSTASSRRLRASRISTARRSAISSRRRAAPWSRHSRAIIVRCAQSISTRWTKRASANC